MAWNQNIPQPGDQLSQSQADLLNNFQAIDTLVNVNHVGFGAGNQGKHLYVQLPEHAAPATAVDEGAVYTKEGTGTVTQLFFRRENNGTEIEMTGGSLGANGWSWLPSGLMVQWGSANVSGSGVADITFSRAFPTTLFNVTISQWNNGGGVRRFVYVDTSLFSASQCRVRCYDSGGTSAAGSVFYFAIGN